LLTRLFLTRTPSLAVQSINRLALKIIDFVF